ncbi:MAG: tyrosine--tRNA ligase [Candidatus Moranbacteria bacterium]|nr:tyrosine--tRNA ligase [Candidatus Moranbacteria bacterium]
MPKVITDEKMIDDLLSRSVKEILPSKDKLKELLMSGKRIRIYIGTDATGSSLHLGHATNYIILEKFRKLGHEVIFLIGDFTARIGDPTDKLAARKQLTREDVQVNVKTWIEQIKPVIDFDSEENPVKVMYNHDWLSKLNFEDVIGIASNFTVQQMLERDMFANRMFGDEESRKLLEKNGITKVTHKTYIKCRNCDFIWPSPIQFGNEESYDTARVTNNSTNCPRCGKITVFDKEDLIQIRPKPVYLHEFFYPLMQGYDSVVMDVDVEMCGNDQKFNALAGRTLLRKIKDKEKFVFITTLLENPVTGEKMMSKSLGTGVFLDEDSNNMFGKIMAQPDENIPQLFTDCTYISLDDVKKMEDQLKSGEANPRDLKFQLAYEIVKIYHGESAANEAKEYFERVFSKKEMPEDISELEVKDGASLIDVLVEAGLAESKADARRKIEQGGVKFDDEAVTDWNAAIDASFSGKIMKVGKREFRKIRMA